MRITTTADDFGYDDDTFACTSEMMEQGAVRNGSIMVRMPASDRAIAFARTNPHLCFGVHLVFCRDTVEAPVSAPGEIPTLVGEDGHFHASNLVRRLAMSRKLSVEDISREVAAQLSVLADAGVRIDYVDSHGHLHKFPVFQEALSRTLPRFGVTRVRKAQDMYCRGTSFRPTALLGPFLNRSLQSRFRTTSRFFMPQTGLTRTWSDEVIDRLARMKQSTIEVGLHPGSVEDWRRDEAVQFTRFFERARAAGHDIVSWRDL